MLTNVDEDQRSNAIGINAGVIGEHRAAPRMPDDVKRSLRQAEMPRDRLDPQNAVDRMVGHAPGQVGAVPVAGHVEHDERVFLLPREEPQQGFDGAAVVEPSVEAEPNATSKVSVAPSTPANFAPRHSDAEFIRH